MLSEPKPSLSCVVVDRGPQRTRTARVLHDGDKKWLIWSSDKIEFNDAERVVLVERDRIHSLPADTYSHGWAKLLIHPRLTNIAGPPVAEGRVTGETSLKGISCWTADVDGMRRHDDTTFKLFVTTDSGITVRIETEGRGSIELEEFESGIRLPEAMFSWSGLVDSMVED